MSQTHPALALLELDSIAVGIRTGDAMVKRSPVELLHAGTVHPGKYLVLVSGAVATVEEALAAGLEESGAALLDHIYLPQAHPAMSAALRGLRGAGSDEALGVVETRCAPAILGAADRGLKGAEVQLLELRLADGLGGKAYCLFGGTVTDVQEAVDLAVGGLRSPSELVSQTVIPRLHDEMRAAMVTASQFFGHLGSRPAAGKG